MGRPAAAPPLRHKASEEKTMNGIHGNDLEICQLDGLARLEFEMIKFTEFCYTERPARAESE
jgi:hypothetical protein